MTVVFFGDSLLDIGNLTATLAPFDIEPYPAPLYNQGKASNGQVLGEAIADRLGIGANSLIGNSTVSTPPNPLENNIVYALAGATTGNFGSKGNDLDPFPIGLQSQIQLFENIFSVANTIDLLDNPIDVIISAGSNDVLEILADPNFVNIFLTPENDDNEALINNTVNKIVDNVTQAIDLLQDKTENITIVGLSPLGDTPFLIKTDQEIDNGISIDIAGQTSALLTNISAQVNQELITKFDNESENIPNVEVIDGMQVFEDGLTAWQNDLSTSPIIDISYLDYISGSSNLEDGLTIEQFAFVDGVHPTSALNQYLAREIVPTELNTPIYRFQNTEIPGTYLYTEEEEKQNILRNYPNFGEEGFAFNVGIEPSDDLITIYRFQNQDLPTAYLYVGEEERQNILQNYANFSEEGIAFYVYGANSDQGENIYRFQNQDLPGAYLYVGEEERQNILQNYPNLSEEGIAFEVAF